MNEENWQDMLKPPIKDGKATREIKGVEVIWVDYTEYAKIQAAFSPQPFMDDGKLKWYIPARDEIMSEEDYRTWSAVRNADG